MRILVLSQYYYPEPFRINEICEELVNRGNQVCVLTANPNYPDGEIYDGYQNISSKDLINGVEIYRCKCRPRHQGSLNLALNYIDFVIHAKKMLKYISRDFDCVYIYQLSPITSCLPAVRYKNRKKIPIFLYCLDVWPESLKGSALDNPFCMKIFGLFSRYIYKSADLIAVTSPTFSNYISNLCEIDKSLIKYIPQHANEIKVASKKLMDKTNINTVNIMFIGNVGEAQNIECLLRAVSYIQDRSKFKVHIVGSGSNYKKCVSYANELELNDTVIFHGRHSKSEILNFYALADICFVSLKNEGVVGNTIPGKVQEYMSAGKPILACMNGDTVDLVKKAKCGICVPADDAHELSKAIIRMTSLETNLKCMGDNAKKYYYNNFRLDSHIDKLERLLGEMVK